MNAFTIAGLVGIGVILAGILIAVTFVWLSKLVTGNQLALSTEQTSFNTGLTLGHKIPLNADPEEQLQAARKEAARRAAAQPRWSNARVGSLGASTLQPASENLEEDPVTAVRIAQFHTWQGARTGISAAAVVAAAPVAAAVAPAAVAKSPEELQPGVDYPVIAITDDMSADDRRKATIANAKARSAAVKALKETSGAVAAPGAAPATAAAVVQAVPVVSVPEPQYIEITDDMSPDDVRKARIANAKTKSAFQKALKEAQEAAPVVAAAPVAQAQQAVPAVVAPAPVASIPEPDYIEITDSMSPDDIRRVRIANAKLKSAYQKTLKEAGVTEAAAPAAVAQAAPFVQAAPTQAVAAAPAAVATAAALPAVPKPEIIEITDDMSPDDIRQARIANAKAKSAYTRALKEAGIDPTTVSLD